MSFIELFERDKSEYSVLCRVCLKTSQDMKPLFTSYFGPKSYSQMLYECSGLQSIFHHPQEGHYPINICGKCEEVLLKSYIFKRQCLKTEAKLFQHLNVFKKIGSESSNTQQINTISNEKEHFLDELSLLKLSETDSKNNNTATDLRDATAHDNKLCHFCGKMLKSNSFKHHVKNHESNKQHNIKNTCKECQKSFISPGALNVHTRIHTSDKRYKCKYCEKIFQHWSTRRDHINRLHLQILPFECVICGGKYSHRHGLQKHIRRHTGEMPYKCIDCEKSFQTTTQLKAHQIVHSGERNHTCTVCNKGFGTNKRLRTHFKIHSGEKNYICPVCSRAFIQNHVLKTHIMKNHPSHEIPPSGTVVSKNVLRKKSSQMV